MNRKTGSIVLWIINIAFVCALALCLLLMIGASIGMYEGLSPAVGLVIAAIGLIGCILLLMVGGAAIVAAATVFVMRKHGNRILPQYPAEETKQAGTQGATGN